MCSLAHTCPSLRSNSITCWALRARSVLEGGARARFPPTLNSLSQPLSSPNWKSWRQCSRFVGSAMGKELARGSNTQFFAHKDGDLVLRWARRVEMAVDAPYF